MVMSDRASVKRPAVSVVVEAREADVVASDTTQVAPAKTEPVKRSCTVPETALAAVYKKASERVAALAVVVALAGRVTIIETMPAAWAGVTAVNSVALLTDTEVAAEVPK